MVKNKKVIAVRQVKAIEIKSPVEIIQSAISSKGGTIEQMKELLAFQKEWEANEATKQFNSAFTAAQASIQTVAKTKYNPQTKSKYSDLNNIIESAKPIYTEHGFAIIFYEGETSNPETVRICADVLHKAGHKETYHYDVPLDGKGIQGNANMTKIHGKASSVSYGRRYLMCMVWNIPTQDDNDGNNSAIPVECINEKEHSQIIDCLTVLKKTEKSFCSLMKIASIDKLPKDKFESAMKTIKIEAERLGIKLC
jgi:hypothetical protein